MHPLLELFTRHLREPNTMEDDTDEYESDVQEPDEDELDEPFRFNDLPPEIRVMILEICLNVPVGGVTYYGHILHSTWEERLDSEGGSDGCSGYDTDATGYHTPQRPKQRINTNVMRLNCQSFSVTAPLLYQKISFECYAFRALKFLKWLPGHLRDLIKQPIILDSCFTEDPRHFEPYSSYSHELARYIATAMDIPILHVQRTAPPDEPSSRSIDKLLDRFVAGYFSELHIHYEPWMIPDETPILQLDDVQDVLVCYASRQEVQDNQGRHYLKVFKEECSFSGEECGSMYPLSFFLTKEKRQTTLVMRHDLKRMEAKLQTMIDADTEHGSVCVQGVKVPYSEERIGLLRQLISDHEYSLGTAAEYKTRYQERLAEKNARVMRARTLGDMLP